MVNVRIFLLFCAFGTSLAIRSFWRGRNFDEFHGDVLTLPPGRVNDQWFDQQVDPYAPTDNKIFHQRYYVNSDYFKSKDGPIFLLIGREGPASPRWMVEGAWIKYAQEFGALCIQLEHRFYGQSQPTPSTTTEDFPFFSSEIALTDVALFITAMNEKFNLTDKNDWIVFGGGYSGALAAWMRVKFPHLVHGAVSSSAPILGKLDFQEYYTTVADATLDCRMSIQEAFLAIVEQLDSESGKKSLVEQLQLCDPLDDVTELDKSNLFENLVSIFGSVVQNNGLPFAKHGIKEICSIMNDEAKGAPLNRLAALNKIFLEDDGQSCLDYKYDKMIKELKETSWEAQTARDGTRQWLFQLCKEFGFFQTSENASFVFSNYLSTENYLKQCSDVFGEQFNRASLEKSIYNNNVIYGGLNIKATNVIYTHGSLDPWHSLGLTETNDDGVRAIFIRGTAHCADMYEPREDDLPELKTARSEIRKFIADLLK
ncbi:thymus-specific serine protease-like [Lutzomyia longipalpis]|uniref:thymus-specific serine protease-like n=1 Tax=Lutzomyia longipalpis TaxID=7200 RepID=UPI002483EFA7|nr:thymus-specific serine protease-like [Lutzomyia longipalpis]